MTFRIACDLDGVAYEWDKTARYMLRQKYIREDRPVPTALCHPSAYWNAIQDAVEPRDWDWLWTLGIDYGLFRYGHCVRGAIEGMEALTHLGDVIIVTARPRAAFVDTYAWVSFMFNRSPIAGIAFTGADKLGVDADVYIDDGPHNILALHAAGRRVVSFVRPWTVVQEGILPGKIARTWPDIIRCVTETREEQGR